MAVFDQTIHLLLGSLGDDILGSLAIFDHIWRLSAFAEAGLPIITVRWSVPLRGFRPETISDFGVGESGKFTENAFFWKKMASKLSVAFC